jgi:hypothetical protein
MNYREQIKKLIDQVEQNDYQQITIDFFQEFDVEFFTRDEDEKPIERDEIGAQQYQIDILLDVFNPALEKDIEVFKEMDKLLQLWHDDIDFRNRSLGIPRHKG